MLDVIETHSEQCYRDIKKRGEVKGEMKCCSVSFESADELYGTYNLMAWMCSVNCSGNEIKILKVCFDAVSFDAQHSMDYSY